MITFRRHGEDRLYERTSTEVGYVVDLIEKGFALPLGYERGTTRNHYLFYSIDDGDSFVVVMDDSNREIVTVLPINWHNAWRISPEAEMMAKDLAVNRENSRYLKPDTNFKLDEAADESKAVVYCELEKLNGKRKGPIGLGKFLKKELEKLQNWKGEEPGPLILSSVRTKIDSHMMAGDSLVSVFWEIDDNRVEVNLPAETAEQ